MLIPYNNSKRPQSIKGPVLNIHGERNQYEKAKTKTVVDSCH